MHSAVKLERILYVYKTSLYLTGAYSRILYSSQLLKLG